MGCLGITTFSSELEIPPKLHGNVFKISGHKHITSFFREAFWLSSSRLMPQQSRKKTSWEPKVDPPMPRKPPPEEIAGLIKVFTLRETNIAMKNGPGWKMYFLLKMGDIPACYVSLPEGINHHSGQIIASSRPGPPKGSVWVSGNPRLFQGYLGW